MLVRHFLFTLSVNELSSSMIDFSAEKESVTHVGSWNISRNAIIWDRNCLFSSVAVT